MSLAYENKDDPKSAVYVASEAGRHVMNGLREIAGKARRTATGLHIVPDELVTDAAWSELIPMLRQRVSQHQMPAAQFDAVFTVWTLARARDSNVRKPGAGPSGDGSYYLSWSFTDVTTVVTVEVTADGACEWFVRDHEGVRTGEGTASEAIEAVGSALPPLAP